MADAGGGEYLRRVTNPLLAHRREYMLWGAAALALALLLYGFYLVFSPFFKAIAWAIILAILLTPVHTYLRRWVPKRGPRALLTCLIAALVLVGPTLTLGTILVGELVESFDHWQEQARLGAIREWDPTNWRPVVWLRDTLETYLAPYLPESDLDRYLNLDQVDLESTVASAAQRLSQFLLSTSRGALSNLATLAFTLVVTWLTLYYLLKDGELFVQRLLEIAPYPDDRKEAMLHQLSGVITSSVYGGLAVAATQGLLGGIAFAVLGLPSPVMWGVVMTILAFVPLLGAFVVWAPATIVLLGQGRWIAALLLLLWGVLVVGLVDNLLRPMLISGSTSMHPLLIFMAVLGGIQAFGFLGLFIGPVLVAIVTAVLDLYRGVVRGDYGELGRAAASADPG